MLILMAKVILSKNIKNMSAIFTGPNICIFILKRSFDKKLRYTCFDFYEYVLVG